MVGLPRWVGRAIGLDVHREFCEVAICEDGEVRSAGRVPATPDGITTLAQSLLASDRVALEVTGSCWEVARILEPHVNRVVVVSPDDTGITSAPTYASTPAQATPATAPGCPNTDQNAPTDTSPHHNELTRDDLTPSATTTRPAAPPKITGTQDLTFIGRSKRRPGDCGACSRRNRLL